LVVTSFSFAELVLEGNRRFVAKGGVKAVGVIDLLDEGADVASGGFEAGVGLAVDLLGLRVLMKLSALALS
jgi:hypothetical protein